MPNVYTGQTLTLEIDSVSYSAQVTRAELVPTQNTNQEPTLSSVASWVDPVTWVLEIENFSDWTATTGISDALYAAAVAGTAIPFELGLPSARTVTGDVVPLFANIGGASADVLRQTYSFPVQGNLTLT